MSFCQVCFQRKLGNKKFHCSPDFHFEYACHRISTMELWRKCCLRCYRHRHIQNTFKIVLDLRFFFFLRFFFSVSTWQQTTTAIQPSGDEIRRTVEAAKYHSQNIQAVKKKILCLARSITGNSSYLWFEKTDNSSMVSDKGMAKTAFFCLLRNWHCISRESAPKLFSWIQRLSGNK